MSFRPVFLAITQISPLGGLVFVNPEFCLSDESAGELATMLRSQGIHLNIFNAFPEFNKPGAALAVAGGTQSAMVPFYDFAVSRLKWDQEQYDGNVVDSAGALLPGIVRAGDLAAAWLRHAGNDQVAMEYAMHTVEAAVHAAQDADQEGKA